jgi:hypothetical protein
MPVVSLEDDAMNPAWCAVAEEQQLVGGSSRAQSNSDEPLLCHEDPNSLNDEALLPWDHPILSQCRNDMLDWNLNGYGLPDLTNVDLGTPPDLQLAVSLSFAILGATMPVCLLIALTNLIVLFLSYSDRTFSLVLRKASAAGWIASRKITSVNCLLEQPDRWASFCTGYGNRWQLFWDLDNTKIACLH